jgi:hypothetical protein
MIFECNEINWFFFNFLVIILKTSNKELFDWISIK